MVRTRRIMDGEVVGWAGFHPGGTVWNFPPALGDASAEPHRQRVHCFVHPEEVGVTLFWKRAKRAKKGPLMVMPTPRKSY
jgi:hypothetical protein